VDDLQSQLILERIKISIGMEQVMPVFNAKGLKAVQPYVHFKTFSPALVNYT
jgi:hypothetical protein